MSELKPCPFCGAQPVVRTENLDERFGYANEVKIQCPSCGAAKSAMGDSSKGGYADNSTTEQRAIEAWNRRAAPADVGEDGLPIYHYDIDGSLRLDGRATEYGGVGRYVRLQDALAAIADLRAQLAARGQGAVKLTRDDEGMCEVSLEIDGQWIPVIRDNGEFISHIVEPQGVSIAIQRSKLNKRFAGRARTPATADFDLPAPNDAATPQPAALKEQP
jgi:Lar family restriction alleviation protein